MTITIPELREKLKRLKTEQIPGVVKGMERALIRIEGSARAQCPVDTGHLRANIVTEVSSDEKSVTGWIGDPVSYAEPVHNGHIVRGGSYYVLPNPFLMNPIMEHRMDTLEDLADALHETLVEVAA